MVTKYEVTNVIETLFGYFFKGTHMIYTEKLPSRTKGVSAIFTGNYMIYYFTLPKIVISENRGWSSVADKLRFLKKSWL